MSQNRNFSSDEIGFSSIQNAQDIIGFFHHNISQHTKEIAVINTTLADLKKDKTDSHFKSNVEEFMEQTSVRLERLSTSFKLLTKQVFHNDSSIQTLINSSIDKLNVKEKDNEIEQIKENQNKILQRIELLENQNQNLFQNNSKTTKNLHITENILIYDSFPIKKDDLGYKKVFFDVSNEENEIKNEIFLEIKAKLETLENQIQNNELNNNSLKTQLETQKEQFSTMKNDVSSLHNLKKDIKKVNDKLQLYLTKEEFNFYLQDSSSPPVSGHPTIKACQSALSAASPYRSRVRSSAISNGRPSTSHVPAQKFERVSVEQSIPSVTVTMMRDNNLQRPSTTKSGGRSSSMKRAKTAHPPPYFSAH